MTTGLHRTAMFTLLSACCCVGIPAETPAQHDIPAGRLASFVIHDSSYMRDRQVWVYTPPGYDAHRADPYPLVVAFDGDEYRDTMPLSGVLDTLPAEGEAPAFVAFLGNQLVHWVRKGWHVTTDPHRVIVTGSSAGGNHAPQWWRMRLGEGIETLSRAWERH
ncbi:MAG TPA: alpha/beta hydrolase-fold protein [Bacteroidota bacterium]|nr:alpha/beta hydrolase-fold protein [Bacteroidota bacterium]